MTKTKKIIPPLTDLGCGLAIEFVQNVGKDKFTIFATLDHAHPESITNNRILAAELERVYREGEASGRRAAKAKAKAKNKGAVT